MSVALAAISLANKMFLACQRLHPQPLPTSEEQFPINKKKKVYVPLPFTLVNSLIVLCLRSLVSYPSLQPTLSIGRICCLHTGPLLGLTRRHNRMPLQKKVVPRCGWVIRIWVHRLHPRGGWWAKSDVDAPDQRFGYEEGPSFHNPRTESFIPRLNSRCNSLKSCR